MKNSTKVGMIVVLTILLSLSLSVAFAGNETVNTTQKENMTNATINVVTPQNCSDLRNCVENCSQIQNCSMYLNCIENCTLNATVAFGEAKGAIPIGFPKIIAPPQIINRLQPGAYDGG